MHNVPEFVQLCRERKFPIEGMRMEVIDIRDEGEEHKGIITLLDEEQFMLEWCKWDCFLSLLAHLKFKQIFLEFLPYCLWAKRSSVIEMHCEKAKKLEVVRAIL